MNNEKVFTVRLPAETYGELKALADARRINVAELMRTFIRLGLLATSEGGPKLLVQEGDELREVMLV